MSPIVVPVEIQESSVIVPMTIETDTEYIPLDVITEIVIRTEGDYYEGSYEVTPKAFESSTLETRDKYLTENVTVQKVPYFEVSNQYGKTIYIADEGVIING